MAARVAWIAAFALGVAQIAVTEDAGAQAAPPSTPLPPPMYGPGQGPSAPPPAYYAPPVAQPAPMAPPGPTPPGIYPVSPRDYGAGPETLEFREGMFVPAGYHLGTRPHQQLLAAGSSMLAGPYVLGLVLSVFDAFDNQKGWLFLPVVGPWLTSSKRVACRNPSLVACTANDTTATVVLAADGIIQGAGVVTMIVAAAVQEKVLRRDGMGTIVVPAAVGSGAGLSALGRF